MILVVSRANLANLSNLYENLYQCVFRDFITNYDVKKLTVSPLMETFDLPDQS